MPLNMVESIGSSGDQSFGFFTVKKSPSLLAQKTIGHVFADAKNMVYALHHTADWKEWVCG